MLHYSSIVRKLTISKKSETVEHETTFVWVLQARQVASNKKLILYVGLDSNIPWEILQEVIASFDACDCEITSVTCDMGPKNRGLATQLGTPFENPQRWMGQNTFPIFLLNDDNMIGEHQKTRMKMLYGCPFEKIEKEVFF